MIQLAPLNMCGEIIDVVDGDILQMILPNYQILIFYEYTTKRLEKNQIITIFDKDNGICDAYKADKFYITIMCDGELAEIHKSRLTTANFVKI